MTEKEIQLKAKVWRLVSELGFEKALEYLEAGIHKQSEANRYKKMFADFDEIISGMTDEELCEDFEKVTGVAVYIGPTSAEDLLAEVRETHKNATGQMILKYDEYEIKDVNLSDIKLNNRALNNCDPSKIQKYKKEIENGADFPCLIVNEDYTLIDGYHRAMANSKAGNKTVRVYVPIIKL